MLWRESDPRCLVCEKSYPRVDGIVALTEATDDRDYPAALVDLVASIERRHFWIAARNDVIVPACGAQSVDATAAIVSGE